MGCQSCKQAIAAVPSAAGTLLANANKDDVKSTCATEPLPVEAALCFEGGGLKSLSCFAGLTAGLLGFCRSETQSQPTLQDSGLYSRYGQLSCVSGGAWFAASLAYSPHFLGMIEAMAANPESAGEIFGKNWTDRWLRESQDDNKLAIMIEEWLKKFDNCFGEATEDILMTFLQLIHVLRKQIEQHGTYTWTDVVAELLSSTAGISKDLEAGATTALPWSSGKVWIVNHGMVTPTEGAVVNKPGVFWNGMPIRAYFLAARTWPQNVFYFLEKDGGEKPPNMLPAAFSVTLGKGTSQSAPTPYAAVHSLPRFHYESNKLTCTCLCIHNVNRTASSHCTACGFDSLTKDAGQLPVIDIVSASSSAVSFTQMLPIELENVANIPLMQLMPVVSEAPNGKAFEAGQDLVNEVRRKGVNSKTVKELSDNLVRGLVDGGLIENSGVAGAVGRGANEVVAFMSNKDDLLQLFGGGEKFHYDYNFTVFGDDLAPIFSSPQAEVVKKVYDGEELSHDFKFQSLTVPSSKHLKSLKVGSMDCITGDSKWFGVKAGRKVKLHVIVVETTIGIFFEDQYRYNRFVQEIVDCLQANKAYVSTSLLPVILGQTGL